MEVVFFVPCVCLLHLCGPHQDMYICELLVVWFVNPSRSKVLAESFTLDCGGSTRSIAAAWVWFIC